MSAYSDSNILVNGLPVQQLKFPGGEINVVLPWGYDNVDKINVIAYLKSSDDVMTLMLTADALQRPISDLFIPYFPYARQDRVCNKGEALSVRVIANMINSLNAARVTIYDPHSDVVGALVNRCTIMKQSSLVPNYILDDKVLVSPDAGAEKKIYDLSKIHGNEVLLASKIRDISTGAITGIRLNGDVCSDKDYLVVDDICDGGRTFIELAKTSLQSAKSLSLWVTHGIFSNGFDELLKHYDYIYYKNSLNQDPKREPNYVHIVAA